MGCVCVLCLQMHYVQKKHMNHILCVWPHSAIHGLKMEAIAEGQGWLAGGGYREKCVHTALTT